jgi:hypothetical protein
MYDSFFLKDHSLASQNGQAKSSWPIPKDLLGVLTEYHTTRNLAENQQAAY